MSKKKTKKISSENSKTTSRQRNILEVSFIAVALFLIFGIILMTGFVKEFTKIYNNYTKGKN